MKKNYIALLLALSFVFILGCSLFTGGPTTDGPTNEEQEAPAQPIEDTAPEAPVEPAATQKPTDVPSTSAPETQMYFTEEFTYDSGNWDVFYMGSGDGEETTFEYSNDRLTIDIGDEDVYMYYLYLPYEYDDVKLTLNAENLGRNNNNVSLVCHVSDAGWYEFSVENGGLWYLYAAVWDEKYGHTGYNILDNGGARTLKQGKEVNEYALECNGDEMTLWVNGDKLKTAKDTRFGLPKGMVGFNISSLNVLPITVDIDWFRIEAP